MTAVTPVTPVTDLRFRDPKAPRAQTAACLVVGQKWSANVSASHARERSTFSNVTRAREQVIAALDAARASALAGDFAAAIEHTHAARCFCQVARSYETAACERACFGQVHACALITNDKGHARARTPAKEGSQP